MSEPLQRILRKAYRILNVIGILYGVFIVFLCIPFFQSHILFVHTVKVPLFAKFDAPERYGLAPGKTLNLHLKTSDNVTIGAWFILSDAYHQSLPLIPQPSTADSPRVSPQYVTKALSSNPTIIFFHGNGGTRAARLRVRYYAGFSSRLHANVLAIDYRGFADSEGAPTEAGLALDARAAWDWVIGHGARPKDVLLVGHSLGTAVAAKLGSELSAQGIQFKGLTLLAPFSSITVLLDTYHMMGFLPLVKPLSMIPGFSRCISRFVLHDFNTRALISSIKSPILLVHARNDWDIPTTHTETLFNDLMEPLLTPLPPLAIDTTSGIKEPLSAMSNAAKARSRQRDLLVSRFTLKNFGTWQEFTNKPGWRIAMLLTEVGGHNGIGSLEGVQDIMRHIFRF